MRHPVTDDEAHEMIGNISGFFNLLLEWNRESKRQGTRDERQAESISPA